MAKIHFLIYDWNFDCVLKECSSIKEAKEYAAKIPEEDGCHIVRCERDA